MCPLPTCVLLLRTAMLLRAFFLYSFLICRGLPKRRQVETYGFQSRTVFRARGCEETFFITSKRSCVVLLSVRRLVELDRISNIVTTNAVETSLPAVVYEVDRHIHSHFTQTFQSLTCIPQTSSIARCVRIVLFPYSSMEYKSTFH